VKGLSRPHIPHKGGFPLVSDADGLDVLGRVALSLESLDCAVNACLDGLDEVIGVMLVPTT
jgi:hypothetical protein